MTKPAQADQRPLPDDPDNWSGIMRSLKSAMIVPSQDRGLVQPCGVFNSKGSYCHDAVLWRGKPLMVSPPKPAAADMAERLEGTYLWGGVIHGHFGHFLVESLGRTWGYHAHKGKIDGVLFVEKRGNASEDDKRPVRWHSADQPVLREFQREVFAQLGITCPIGLVAAPVRVETLVVPGQGFGMGAMAAGTPAYRSAVHDHFGKDIAPEGPERIYLSRSAYGARRGGVIGETRIEERLKQDGYEIYHPQDDDLRTQIARYKAAREIVALDGSALHLLAMVARPDQKVAMIRRRSSSVSEGIETHLASFSGTPPLVIDAIKQNWLRSDRKRVDRFSLAELDFPALGKALGRAGMASAEGWTDMEDTERDAIIADLNRETQHSFRQQGQPAPKGDDLPDGIVATCHGIQIPASFAVEPRWLVRKINNGRYEKEEIAGALHLVSDQDRVLECGAGIGIVGTTIAHNRRPKKMLSFEANPNMIPVVEATYKHNRVGDIISVTHGALMSAKDAPETISFNISKRFAFSSLDAPQRELSETVSVPVHNFADVKEDFKPTVLLMDIEGGELDFLEGADLSGINTVVMEFHPEVYGTDGMARCKTLLTDAGFEPVTRKSTDTVWAASRAPAA